MSLQVQPELKINSLHQQDASSMSSSPVGKQRRGSAITMLNVVASSPGGRRRTSSLPLTSDGRPERSATQRGAVDDSDGVDGGNAGADGTNVTSQMSQCLQTAAATAFATAVPAAVVLPPLLSSFPPPMLVHSCFCCCGHCRRHIQVRTHHM